MSAAGQRKKSGGQESNALIARNRRAFHDYAFSDRYEAGIALQGTEIKSIRAGQASLREGYVRPRRRRGVAGGCAYSSLSGG